MNSLNLRTNTSVWLVTIAFTVLTSTVVTAAILFMYPPEEWAFEITLSLALTISLTVGVSQALGSLARKNQIMGDELQRLVDRDRLTNVSTRDHFFAWMDEPAPFSGVSLMVDIDHFKRVNDTYGHLAGDKVIREVAEILQTSVRPTDLVARFGGEEFLVFLRNHSLLDAHSVAERMRLNVEQKTFTHEGKRFQVTVSIGGACKARQAAIEAAISEADAALYTAKKSGRNRTCIDLPDAPELDAAG